MASTGTVGKTQVHPVNEVLRQSLKAGDIIADDVSELIPPQTPPG